MAALRAPAQSSPSPSPTKALSHAIHAVDDLDTTLAFYRSVFGLNGTPEDFPNPAVPLLTNAPGVTLRLSMLSLPGGMRFELTHFKGLERKAAQARYTDPGPASLVFYVRDIDAAVANAKKANAPIVTTGGAPVEIATAKGKARSISCATPTASSCNWFRKHPRRTRRRATSIAFPSLTPWRMPMRTLHLHRQTWNRVDRTAGLFEGSWNAAVGWRLREPSFGNCPASCPAQTPPWLSSRSSAACRVSFICGFATRERRPWRSKSTMRPRQSAK